MEHDHYCGSSSDNVLIDMMKNQIHQVDFISESAPNINILLYADDMVQCGNTVGQLRSHIFEKYCSSWGMKVNLKKPKIMVFGRGGPLKKMSNDSLICCRL